MEWATQLVAQNRTASRGTQTMGTLGASVFGVTTQEVAKTAPLTRANVLRIQYISRVNLTSTLQKTKFSVGQIEPRNKSVCNISAP